MLDITLKSTQISRKKYAPKKLSKSTNDNEDTHVKSTQPMRDQKRASFTLKTNRIEALKKVVFMRVWRRKVLPQRLR